jgi:hypothetical protein
LFTLAGTIPYKSLGVGTRSFKFRQAEILQKFALAKFGPTDIQHETHIHDGHLNKQN